MPIRKFELVDGRKFNAYVTQRGAEQYDKVGTVEASEFVGWAE